MVIDELNNEESCFGKYLREATTKKIDSIGPASAYGYQIWVRCSMRTDFCFIGYGGQYLLFNIATKTVLYHHATSLSQSVRGTQWVMDSLIQALNETGPNQ
jgi:hypothetical protein